MQFVRPECVGGGPDDCIGPALTIMLCTLLVAGWILGWMLSAAKLPNVLQNEQYKP